MSLLGAISVMHKRLCEFGTFFKNLTTQRLRVGTTSVTGTLVWASDSDADMLEKYEILGIER